MKSVKKLNRQSCIMLAVLVIVICVGLIFAGFMYAKYVREYNFGGNVTISADLAEKFDLYEHKVEQKTDGSFNNATLNPDGSFEISGGIVYENKYYVLPGIDIPKDPTVSISGKTSIPSYLFIEVVDNVDHSIISFDIASHWQVVEDAKPVNGGVVYVFAVNGEPLLLDDKTDPDLISSIGIITGNKLTVSPITKGEDRKDKAFYNASGNEAAALDLDFYAYLVQKSTGESVADVFNKLQPAAPAQTEASTETVAVTEAP